MIQLRKRNSTEYYIDYQGDSLKDYMRFTAFLSDVPSRKFDEKEGAWYCAANDAQHIQDKLDNLGVGNGMKLKPYDYQRQAIAFCCKHGFSLVHLPCGAGKTPIGLGTFLELRKKDPKLRGIFVVKASLKNQWLDEVSKFTDLRANVLYTFKAATKAFQTKIKKRRKTLEFLLKDAMNHMEEIKKLENEISKLEKKQMQEFKSYFDIEQYDIFIVNYETILDEAVRTILHAVNPQFWYVDEIDCIKSNKAQRSKAIYEFNTSKYRFGATATPIRKNPKDLFGIFSFLKPDLFPDERKFDRTFLKFWYGRVSGSQNEELLSKMVEPYIFRRTLDQIADQLPKQTVFQVYCTFSEKQKKIYAKLSAEIDELNNQKKTMYNRFTPQQLAVNAEYKRIEDAIAARQTFAQMQADSEELLRNSESHMAHAYLTGEKSNKVETCLSLIEKVIASDQKVCIFSRYLGIQDILKREIAKDKELKGVIVDSITGATSADERSHIIKEINEKEDHRVLLLSDSGEAGLNLGAIRYLIEFELADSAAKQTQRHGRIQRADSIHKNVFVFQLITRDSWDEVQWKIVNKKQEYSNKILD